ncbi:hypothetical protein MSAN_01923600 [Mycena sanguinolenta]|uniref:F-box domain-containing protein n=1 Tax=Mycena sanguinolenta TaxID=230812 RepID=A0A8H7CNM7_9AGAR|nr:hypothetical protein MSAN_01923600 [Mycena sanguinolenta]
MPADPIGPFEFIGTNSLRRLECEYMGSIYDCPVSWGTLTHLTASNVECTLPDLNTLLRMLRRCPQLETCELKFGVFRLSHSAIIRVDYDPLSLPHLRHLFIKHPIYFPDDGTQFLHNLALPALRSFQCEFFADALPTGPLQFLFPSSMDRLECLKVKIKRCPSELLLTALAAMPFLGELHLIGEPVTPERRRDPHFLTHLMPGAADAESALCPRLWSVELSEFTAVGDSTIFEFVLSRTDERVEALHASKASQLRDVVQLRRFTCRLQREMYRNILPNLEGTGCVVELKYEQQKQRQFVLGKGGVRIQVVPSEAI